MQSYFDIRFEHFICFTKLVQLRNFTKTAELLGISQASVSQYLKDLESAFGHCCLIKRTSRHFEITSQGQNLYSIVTRTLYDLDKFVMKNENKSQVQMFSMNISVSSIPGEYILPKMIVQFQNIFPNIQINLQVSNTLQAIKDLEQKTTPFCAIGNIDAIDISKYEIQKIGSDEILIIARKKHPIFRHIQSDKITSESELVHSLQKYPWIFRESGSATRSVFLNKFPSSSTFKIGLEFHSNTAILHALENSDGLSALSSYLIQNIPENQRFQPVQCRFCPQITRDFYLIKLKNRLLLPEEQQFWVYIQKNFTNIS